MAPVNCSGKSRKTDSSTNEARMALAGQEKETQLLTERLGQTEQKMEKLDQDRLTLLIEKAELQVFVAHQIKVDKDSERTDSCPEG
jgi:hypothetical protein